MAWDGMEDGRGWEGMGDRRKWIGDVKGWSWMAWGQEFGWGGKGAKSLRGLMTEDQLNFDYAGDDVTFDRDHAHFDR